MFDHRRLSAAVDEKTGLLVVVLGLLCFAAGYEAGSVLAGDVLELSWLIPVFGAGIAAALLVVSHYE